MASICKLRLETLKEAPDAESGRIRSSMESSCEYLKAHIRSILGVLVFVVEAMKRSSRMIDMNEVMPLPPLTSVSMSCLKIIRNRHLILYFRLFSLEMLGILTNNMLIWYLMADSEVRPKKSRTEDALVTGKKRNAIHTFPTSPNTYPMMKQFSCHLHKPTSKRMRLHVANSTAGTRRKTRPGALGTWRRTIALSTTLSREGLSRAQVFSKNPPTSS